VTALTYDPGAVAAQLDDELRERLATEAPDGYTLDGAVPDVGAPQPVEEEPEGTRFRLSAEAEAVAVLDEEELAQRLAGKDRAEAEAILEDVPEIEAFDVAYRPGFLPDRMPGSAGRIGIEAAS